VAGLEDADAAAGACEQHSHGESGEAGADDHVVEPVVGREGVLDPGAGAVEPQGRHVSSSSSVSR
jgi:hypothetical protein